jgi:hypothetical protein
LCIGVNDGMGGIMLQDENIIKTTYCVASDVIQ